MALEFFDYNVRVGSCSTSKTRFPCLQILAQAGETPSATVFPEDYKKYDDATTVTVAGVPIKTTMGNVDLARTFTTYDPATGEELGTASVTDFITLCYSYCISEFERANP